MTRPGDTVYIVLTHNEGHTARIGVFASVKGANDYVNDEIRRAKSHIEGPHYYPDDLRSLYVSRFMAPDPGPEHPEDRLFWWNKQMGTYVGTNQTFISFQTHIVED